MAFEKLQISNEWNIMPQLRFGLMIMKSEQHGISFTLQC